MILVGIFKHGVRTWLYAWKVWHPRACIDNQSEVETMGRVTCIFRQYHMMPTQSCDLYRSRAQVRANFLSQSEMTWGMIQTELLSDKKVDRALISSSYNPEWYKVPEPKILITDSLGVLVCRRLKPPWRHGLLFRVSDGTRETAEKNGRASAMNARNNSDFPCLLWRAHDLVHCMSQVMASSSGVSGSIHAKTDLVWIIGVDKRSFGFSVQGKIVVFDRQICYCAGLRKRWIVS
jgi:hypothetical protein